MRLYICSAGTQTDGSFGRAPSNAAVDRGQGRPGPDLARHSRSLTFRGPNQTDVIDYASRRQTTPIYMICHRQIDVTKIHCNLLRKYIATSISVASCAKKEKIPAKLWFSLKREQILQKKGKHGSKIKNTE